MRLTKNKICFIVAFSFLGLVTYLNTEVVGRDNPHHPDNVTTSISLNEENCEDFDYIEDSESMITEVYSSEGEIAFEDMEYKDLEDETQETFKKLFEEQEYKYNVKPTLTSSRQYSDYEIAMWNLKYFEGIHLTSYFDINHWTQGWGTRGEKGGTITLQEADIAVRNEYERQYQKNKKRYPNLDRFTLLIVASLDFNIGEIGPNLDRALKSGNKEMISRMIIKYDKDANGKQLLGLTKRRNAEAWLITASEEERQAYGKSVREKVKSKIIKAIMLRDGEIGKQI